MKLIFLFCTKILWISVVDAIEVGTHLPTTVAKALANGRRVLNGEPVLEGKAYMAYLKLPRSNEKLSTYRTWLCGAVIVHEEYILTSAACIEDVQHFYVVSGTYKYSDEADKYTNLCIKNGAKKAVWKCIPKNYDFDGHENDNIKWMNNDIAVVKMESPFDFERKVKGCDFVPKPVCYNNQSQALEAPGTVVSLAGWGTTFRYNDWVNRRRDNQQVLLETTVEIINKAKCKRRWGPRYHNIIDNYMICSRDIGQSMSEICNEKFVECSDILYSDEEENRRAGRHMKSERVPVNLRVHTAYHDDMGFDVNRTAGSRRAPSANEGGFCENDHGGPLVYGEGVGQMVIGIISACLVKEKDNKCHGPFLYTSIFKNRHFISCAIFKDMESKCRRSFRAGENFEEKYFSWIDHPDGPAATEKPQKTGSPKKEGSSKKEGSPKKLEEPAKDKNDTKPLIPEIKP